MKICDTKVDSPILNACMVVGRTQMADDSEQELLLESRESEKSTVDEGLIIQLSKRDSTSVTTRPGRRARSTDTEVRNYSCMCTTVALSPGSLSWGERGSCNWCKVFVYCVNNSGKFCVRLQHCY
jgi:hypothetical protein